MSTVIAKCIPVDNPPEKWRPTQGLGSYCIEVRQVLHLEVGIDLGRSTWFRNSPCHLKAANRYKVNLSVSTAVASERHPGEALLPCEEHLPERLIDLIDQGPVIEPDCP